MTPDPHLVYHITHVDNLPSIVGDGQLRCDADVHKAGGPPVAIGMTRIKRSRIERREVRCHPGTMVGDYVPFYFCPRSVMLYVIHRGNDAALDYRGGQEPIVHLVADLREVVAWADGDGRRWAFSLSNAGAAYTEFRKRLDQLVEVDWQAIGTWNWRDPAVKERKQAEFLVHGQLTWALIRRIGVRSRAIASRVRDALAAADNRPVVSVESGWYYREPGGSVR